MLLSSEMANQIAKPTDVDGSHLFDEHPGERSVDLDFGTEGRRSSVCRRGSNEDDRPGEERLGLHNNTEPLPLLFVTAPFWEAQSEDVTPTHVVPP